MRIFPALALSALALALITPAARAQQQAAPPCIAATTLDDLAKAIDQAVSGPVEMDRSCFRTLFAPNALITPLTVAADGSTSTQPLTVEGWITRVKSAGLTAFYEHQAKFSSERFGHLAHLWSTYQIRFTPDGPVKIQGINSIDALWDGSRWRIYTLTWLPESPTETLPAQYRP